MNGYVQCVISIQWGIQFNLKKKGCVGTRSNMFQRVPTQFQHAINPDNTMLSEINQSQKEK